MNFDFTLPTITPAPTLAPGFVTEIRSQLGAKPGPTLHRVNNEIVACAMRVNLARSSTMTFRLRGDEHEIHAGYAVLGFVTEGRPRLLAATLTHTKFELLSQPVFVSMLESPTLTATPFDFGCFAPEYPLALMFESMGRDPARCDVIVLSRTYVPSYSAPARPR